MARLKGKHNIGDIEGTRCTMIETSIPLERAEFLRNLMMFNGYEVKMEREKAKDGSDLNTYMVGVTDILFNPMIAVYAKKLKRRDGMTVTPAFWNQWTQDETLPYWKVVR